MNLEIPLFDTEMFADWRIAGVDEAGRGPLCGDVYAAAVILDPDNPIEGLMDSKKLTEKKRFALREEIMEKALAYSIASSSLEEIETLNILQATLLAMRRAVEGLAIQPDKVLVDGNQNPKIPLPTECVVKGDSLHAEISAASILAKTERDLAMITLDKILPEYGFAKHKGYGTKAHMEALEKYGVTEYHRRDFAPIRKILAK